VRTAETGLSKEIGTFEVVTDHRGRDERVSFTGLFRAL